MECSGKVMKSWWMMRLAYALFFIAAGADKFFNMVTMWSKYASPTVMQYIPMELSMVLMIVGVIEILIGLLILTRTCLGSMLAGVWLLLMAGNLVTMSIYMDIAVRDVVLAVGAFALACLTSCYCNCAMCQKGKA